MSEGFLLVLSFAGVPVRTSATLNTLNTTLLHILEMRYLRDGSHVKLKKENISKPAQILYFLVHVLLNYIIPYIV